MPKKLALCLGRHEMPENDGNIFSQEVNPLDIKGLEEQAEKTLTQYKKQSIEIYVTGLTVALISALNICRKLDIKVTLLHFNRDNGTYYPQEVL